MDLTDVLQKSYRLLIPAERLPLTWRTLPILLVPQPLVAAHAFLNVRRAPRWVQLALLPITVLAIVRAHASVYLEAPKFNIFNQLFGVAACLMIVKSLEWSLVHANRRAAFQRPGPRTLLTDALDTLDLLTDSRGILHTFGQRCHLRASPHARPAFLRARLASLAGNFLLFDSLKTLVRFCGPVGSPEGGPIYLPALAPPARAATAVFLTLCIGGAIYSYMATLDALLSLLLVGALGAPPARWPPLFDRPWRTHSLADFWARRWHQLFRRPFVVCSWAGRALAGDSGAVLCAFLASGVLHEAGMRCMGRGPATPLTLGFFGAQGVGCLVEAGWTRATGREVRGWAGAVWAWVWLLGWGQLVGHAWAVRGTAGGMLYPDALSPVEFMLERLMGIRTPRYY